MAVSIDHYDQFVELMGDVAAGYTGYAGETAIMIALLDSDHTFTAANDSFADVSSNQIPGANGYTQADGAGAGKALASVTSSQPAAGIWMLDAADVSWTASGGPIPSTGNCDSAVTFNDDMTTPANALLFDIDFGQNESAGDGTNFNVNWNANGICRIS